MVSSAPSPSSSATFFSGPTRKRFRPPPAAQHLPILLLNREGTITSLTEAAKRVLEYPAEADTLDPCFFSHVHASNQHRLMRDLADMVCRGKQRAQWLLRLRTGKDRWRWYRTIAKNDLGPDGTGIRVRLRPL